MRRRIEPLYDLGQPFGRLSQSGLDEGFGHDECFFGVEGRGGAGLGGSVEDVETGFICRTQGRQ